MKIQFVSCRLLPSIVAQIQSSDPLRMYNALLAFRQMVKRYEHKMDESKKDLAILDALIDTTFPLLQAMFGALVNNNSIEAAHIMRMTCKVFWSCVHYHLPRSQAVDTQAWFQFFGQLLGKRLPEASEGVEPLGQPVDPDDRKAWGWWKVSALNNK
jgi:hypothetical protein